MTQASSMKSKMDLRSVHLKTKNFNENKKKKKNKVQIVNLKNECDVKIVEKLNYIVIIVRFVFLDDVQNELVYLFGRELSLRCRGSLWREFHRGWRHRHALTSRTVVHGIVFPTWRTAIHLVATVTRITPICNISKQPKLISKNNSQRPNFSSFFFIFIFSVSFWLETCNSNCFNWAIQRSRLSSFYTTSYNFTTFVLSFLICFLYLKEKMYWKVDNTYHN